MGGGWENWFRVVEWQSWFQAWTEGLVIGLWITSVPATVLLLLSAVTTLGVGALRSAWLASLLLGLIAFSLQLTGFRLDSVGWGVFRLDPGLEGLPAFLPAVYFVGVAFVLSCAGTGWRTIRRWTSRAQPVSDSRVIEAFEVAKAAHSVERTFYVLVSDSVPAPITVGWLNHRVLLPQKLVAQLNDAELRDLALHEIAHIKRRDPAAFALAVLAKAIFWPNPFVWLAVHQLKLNAEKHADESVIAVTNEVRPYSRLLLKMADLSSPRSTIPLAAGVNLHRSDFIQRAEALLGGILTGVRRPSSSLAVWAGFVLGSVGALAFVPEFPGEPTRSATSSRSEAAFSGGDGTPVDNLLRDGLFAGEGWVRLNDGSDSSGGVVPELDARWLETLELSAAPRFLAYRHLYGDDGSKLSIFCFKTEGGARLFVALDRGEAPFRAERPGSWLIGRNGFDPETMTLVAPGSNLEQAIVHLLKAWPRAALGGGHRWQRLLSEWPEVPAGSVTDVALMMGESLETFGDLRVEPE